MEDKQKPELFLVRPDDFEGMIEFVRKVSGREPTPEKLEDAKMKFAKLQELFRQRLGAM